MLFDQVGVPHVLIHNKLKCTKYHNNAKQNAVRKRDKYHNKKLRLLNSGREIEILLGHSH